MSATHHINLPREVCLFAHMRAMVEDGLEDGPVIVSRDGKPSVRVASLFRGALLTVTHEPGIRFASWTPHPMATVGPRVSALLAARAEQRARR